MRGRRSAKFAEYLSTYAILEHIGIHDTLLIEKRDASVGISVFVRDACDAGTTLFVIPSRRFCTLSVLSKTGLKAAWHPPGAVSSLQGTKSPACDAWSALQDGLIAYLTSSADWIELSWRLALERHRSVSPLWGWLESLPSMAELVDQTELVDRRCRVSHAFLSPYYTKAKMRVEEEKAAAYKLLRGSNLMPSFELFSWAVDVLLTRGHLLPTAWQSPSATSSLSTSCASTEEGKEEAGVPAQVELGVVPFMDLVNAADDAGRVANAEIEMVTSVTEVPDFFLQSITDALASKGEDGKTYVEKVLQDHYYLCLTLKQPLLPSAEVLVDYRTPVVATGALTPKEDALMSRFLKYKF